MDDPWLPIEFPAGRLRRFRPQDRPDFQAYRALPELGRYQGWRPMSDDEAGAFIAEVACQPLFTPGEWIQLALADRVTDALNGDIGLWLSEDATRAEIGFTVAPAAQGRGLATQAVQAVADLLTRAAGVQLLQGITDERNGPSRRVLERAGFQRVLVQDAVFRGEPCVEWVYERSLRSPAS